MRLFVQYCHVVREREVVESSNLVEMLLAANGTGLTDHVISVVGKQAHDAGSNRRQELILDHAEVKFDVGLSVKPVTDFQVKKVKLHTKWFVTYDLRKLRFSLAYNFLVVKRITCQSLLSYKVQHTAVVIKIPTCTLSVCNKTPTSNSNSDTHGKSFCRKTF